MTAKRTHPEAPRHTEVSFETAKALREWAEDLTRGKQDVLLTVDEEVGEIQLAVMKGKGSADWDFMITCHEPSSDFTTRHTFLTFREDSIEMDEFTTINPTTTKTADGTDETFVGEQPVEDRQARAGHVVRLLKRGQV